MNNVYNRPMFQNPQQRAGGGIMAGVAPINMEVSPARMSMGGIISEEGAINPEADSGIGVTDIAKFIFDPSDPIDQATLALMAVPGLNVAARLASMGLKGAKLIRQLKKVEQATKSAQSYTNPALAGVVAGGPIGSIVMDPQAREDYATIGELGLEEAKLGLQNLGGIMGLAEGGEASKEEEIPDDLKDFFDFTGMTASEFDALPEEDQNAFIDSFADRTSLISDIASSAPAAVFTTHADLANNLLEGIGGLGQELYYSDISKALGIADPRSEIPLEDPSFEDSRQSLIAAQPPSSERIQEFLTPPPPPELPPAVEERIDEGGDGGGGEVEDDEPGFFSKLAGGLTTLASRAAGLHLPDDEYQAMLIASGRRPLGVSRAQAYNDALREIREGESMNALRKAQAESYGKSDMQQAIEYIQQAKPGTSFDDALSDYMRASGRSTSVTQDDISEAVLDQAAALLKNENVLRNRLTAANESRAADNKEPFTLEEYVLETATRMVYAAYGLGVPTRTQVAAIVDNAGKEITKTE